ncbi:hypothetical protein [Enterococcus plantarum]|uniref:hypothetical protein n=1 Tax=Enterococcus plantarum TaxID=1077675 RepID=UPI001A8F40A5|nr:hypothetical protein [Enterococcus plantarum]MBO0423583.1 hypothetical protein [Enterococcus plantarum]
MEEYQIEIHDNTRLLMLYTIDKIENEEITEEEQTAINCFGVKIFKELHYIKAK